jgi:transglutaminase-like putative cysteine protease
MMQIRVGFELVYECPQPTPMVLTLNVHYTRASDIVFPDYLMTDPAVPVMGYRDSFGNWCTRIVAPEGRIRLSSSAVVRDSGAPDPVVATAVQHQVQDLPEETLLFLLASRYCETDRLSETAWDLFGHSATGWGRVQAICDFFTTTSPSAMSMRVPPRPPTMRSASGPASAETSPISLSRSAAA